MKEVKNMLGKFTIEEKEQIVFESFTAMNIPRSTIYHKRSELTYTSKLS